ncbi:MAG: lytic transglycosylase domain-containing protein [Solirubrobacteraceae bacterium]
MSAQALSGSSGVPAGELALMARVRQLQGLIESERLLASPGSTGADATTTPAAMASSYTQSPYGDFASALQAATSDDNAGTGGAATVADTSPGIDYGAVQGSAGEESGEYDALIEQAAARNGVDPAVLHGLIQQESGFNPDAVSSAGASGLTQLMPGTASTLGVADTLDPAESIEGGARYLGELTAQFGGNTEDALAAYNAGPGAVEQYGGIPPYAETQSYVADVLGDAQAYQQSHPSNYAAGPA